MKKITFFIIIFIYAFNIEASTYKLKHEGIICTDLDDGEGIMLFHFNKENFPFELNNVTIYLKRFWKINREGEPLDELETPIFKYDFKYLYDADHIFFYDITKYDVDKLDTFDNVLFFIQRDGLLFFDRREIQGSCKVLKFVEKNIILDIITR